MSLIAKFDSENTERELPSIGVYQAVCVWVIDMGMQESTYMGVTKLKRKLKLSFELCGSKMKDGRPFLVSAQHTLTLAPMGNLKPFLENWRGRAFTAEEMSGFDMKNILGAPCQINVIHNQSEDGQNTYANIGSIMPLAQGAPKPLHSNELIFYSTEEHDEAMFQKIPEGIRSRINRPAPATNSFAPPQEQVSSPANPAPEFEDDDIPF